MQDPHSVLLLWMQPSTSTPLRHVPCSRTSCCQKTPNRRAACCPAHFCSCLLMLVLKRQQRRQQQKQLAPPGSCRRGCLCSNTLDTGHSNFHKSFAAGLPEIRASCQTPYQRLLLFPLPPLLTPTPKHKSCSQISLENNPVKL
jgi:hypothetical protein